MNKMETMGTMEVKMAGVPAKYKGFFIQKGFFIIRKNGEIFLSSGWQHEIGEIFVYRYIDGTWSPSWASDRWGSEELSFSPDDAVELISQVERLIERSDIKKCLNALKGKIPHKSCENIYFTYVEADEKSLNGGEYGFYERYEPTKHEGIYKVWDCSTSELISDEYMGMKILTTENYALLKRKSDQVKKRGSRY